jgi:hypothetical protein
VVLYAQLAALVEIRRRLFGLTGRQQWRRSEVKPGIVNLIGHWRNKQMRKYATHIEARLNQVSMTPDQLIQQPIEFFTRSTMDDMIHEVNSHLHYARRARLRAELNIMIRKREERFQAGKVKSVLNSVLKREQNRFKNRIGRGNRTDVDYTDFEAGINARSNNRSPGITRFSANMLKQMSGKIKQVMFELLNHLWQHKRVPQYWKNKWVVLIPKDPGPNVSIDRLRPICLLEQLGSYGVPS